jgi:YD repeat-containing protein
MTRGELTCSVMSESGEPSRIETRLYDADGNLTADESLAVRGEVVELDAEGRVIARHDQGGLAWKVDPKSLEGDPGELATRPKHRPS